MFTEMEQLVQEQVRELYECSPELQARVRFQLKERFAGVCAVMDVEIDWLVDAMLEDFVVVPKR